MVHFALFFVQTRENELQDELALREKLLHLFWLEQRLKLTKSVSLSASGRILNAVNCLLQALQLVFHDSQLFELNVRIRVVVWLLWSFPDLDALLLEVWVLLRRLGVLGRSHH